MVDTAYYTVPRAAELLGTDTDKVLNWIHSGELEAVNIATNRNGKRPRWRVAESALGKFLLARRHPASTQAPSTPRRRKAANVTEFF